MILIDKDGHHILKNGIKDKSFFIYPYQQVYTQQWSNDLKKDHRSTIQVDRFDTRNQCKSIKFINLFSILCFFLFFDRYGL
jgi:hypothetical protein